ncbi:hypothetical protein H0E87_029589 [Populus deltoides]|uniref:Uncharacterized protein n=1 Tax=Populus deltoides TaxID=3696 RepID=A0A8T2WLI0_POPDE|nr:hypothetical protein H0E87_029589 [Populus deltoides]
MSLLLPSLRHPNTAAPSLPPPLHPPSPHPLHRSHPLALHPSHHLHQPLTALTTCLTYLTTTSCLTAILLTHPPPSSSPTLTAILLTSSLIPLRLHPLPPSAPPPSIHCAVGSYIKSSPHRRRARAPSPAGTKEEKGDVMTRPRTIIPPPGPKLAAKPPPPPPVASAITSSWRVAIPLPPPPPLFMSSSGGTAQFILERKTLPATFSRHYVGFSLRAQLAEELARATDGFIRCQPPWSVRFGYVHRGVLPNGERSIQAAKGWKWAGLAYLHEDCEFLSSLPSTPPSAITFGFKLSQAWLHPAYIPVRLGSQVAKIWASRSLPSAHTHYLHSGDRELLGM